MEDKQQEDLDMLYVLNSIKKGIQSIFTSIGRLLDYSLQNFRKLALFSLVAGLMGLGLYYLTTPYYMSELTVSHIRLENDYCKELINSLSSSISGKTGNAGLAKKLKLSQKEAQNIKNITYKVLNEQIAKRYSDSTRVMLPFKIEVEVYENEILDTLQKHLLDYLEYNEYAVQRKELEKQSLDKIEQRLNQEISRLDSLKLLVDKGIVPQNTGTGIILGQPINPVVIYEATMKLYEQKTKINEKQQLNNNFDLVVGFSENELSSSGKLFYIVIGMAVGYFIGLIYLYKKG